MTTKEYLQYLEIEEKRNRLRAMIADDPAREAECKLKEKRAKEIHGKLQRLWEGVNTAAFRYGGQPCRMA